MNGIPRDQMLRTTAMGQPPAMLGMNSSFIPNPQMGQQGIVGMNNPAMNMLAQGTPSQQNIQQQQQQQRLLMAHQQQQQVAAQLAAGQQPQQRALMRPGQGPQGMMMPGNPQQVAPHMAGLNPQQMPGVFPQGMPNQQIQNPGALRRNPSQSQMGMNNPVASGGISLPQAGPSMNPGQLRQVHLMQQQQQQQQQRQHQLQMQHQQQQQQQQQQQHHQQQQQQMAIRGGNPAMQPSMTGVGPSQNPVMNSLSQPPSIGPQQHSMNMGQPHLQQPFVNSIGPQPHGLTSSSPRPNSMGMGPGPTQNPGNRASMTPDNAMGFMNNYPGNNFSPNGQQQRMSNPPVPYPFAGAPTPPVSSDMTERPFPTPAQQLQMNSTAGVMNNPGDPFSAASFASPMPPRAPSQNPIAPHPIHTPQLSQRQTPQPTQSRATPQPGPSSQHHHSPIHPGQPPEQMPMQPSRPQSRPQSQAQMHPHQAASPHGQPLRSGQAQQPPAGGAMPPPTRLGTQPTQTPQIIPPPPPPSQPHQQQQQSQQQQPQRPQQMLQPQHTGGQQQPTTPGLSGPEQFMGSGPQPMAPLHPPQHRMSAGPSTMPAAQKPDATSLYLGSGQGIVRLLAFSGLLANENKMKLTDAYWNNLVMEYFTPKANMELQMYKDEMLNEVKRFEIGVACIPRFFLVTTQAGVKSMQFSLDGARERIMGQGRSTVQCVQACWTYNYTNGYTVVMRGPLTINVQIVATYPPAGPSHQGQPFTLKFSKFRFDIVHCEKTIALNAIHGERQSDRADRIVYPWVGGPPAPSSLTYPAYLEAKARAEAADPGNILIERATFPHEPVNSFGIPQASMRCLELAESVGIMEDLMVFSYGNDFGAFEGLAKYTENLRAAGVTLETDDDQEDSPSASSAPMHPPPPPPLMPTGLPPQSQAPPPQQQQQQPQSQPQQTPQHQQPQQAPQHQQQQPQQQQQLPFPPHNGLIPPVPSAQPPHNSPMTLYQSAPQNVINSYPPPVSQQQQIIPPPPQATIASPQNSSSASNSPQKQHRSIPGAGSNNANGGGGGGASSPAMSASGSTSQSTPSMSNASLKRKGGPSAGDGSNNGASGGSNASPTLANGEQPPPAKRPTRKRGKTAAANAANAAAAANAANANAANAAGGPGANAAG